MEELTHLMGVGAVTSTGLTGAASRAGTAAWFPRPLGKRLFCLLGSLGLFSSSVGWVQLPHCGGSSVYYRTWVIYTSRHRGI